MKVLVVDDEPVARRRLVRMLAQLEDVVVAGEAGDGEEALDQAVALDPDVVLLDIRMPGMNGLDLAARLPDRVHVIFTTAYDEYAVAAFEAEAVDYLLKPVEAARLAAALDKVRRLAAPADPEALGQLLRRLTGEIEPPRITARRGDTLRLFDPREIPRFHSRDGYTAFRHGGSDYLLEESIVSLEARLAGWGFVRVHRAEMVNLHHVRALKREDDATFAELADGQRSPVSRRHLPALKKALGIAGG